MTRVPPFRVLLANRLASNRAERDAVFNVLRSSKSAVVFQLAGATDCLAMVDAKTAFGGCRSGMPAVTLAIQPT